MRSSVVLLASALLAACQTTSGQITQIETRPGGSVSVHTYRAEQPKATILMFEGAGGVFNPGGRGFVNSNYSDFVERGFTAVIMEPPADQNSFPRGGGMHPRFRETPAHVRDIDAVISMLRKEAPTSIWILGISMGTKSVANYASSRPNKIDGVVFLSSSTRPPPAFQSVTDYNLGSIASPVLAVAHSNDGCSGTPPQGANEIADAARKSKEAKALILDGGSNFGRSPCGPDTPHTFSGIEGEVVSAISAFIAKHSK